MATESLRELAKDLNGKIAEIRSGVYDLSTEIEGYLKSKKDAQERYNQCLNAGDSVGMGVWLGAIKKASKEIENLKSQLEVFSQKALALDELHREMKVVEQRDIKEYEAALKVVGEMKKRNDEGSNLYLGMAVQLSELRESIDEKFSSFGKICWSGCFAEVQVT